MRELIIKFRAAKAAVAERQAALSDIDKDGPWKQGAARKALARAIVDAGGVQQEILSEILKHRGCPTCGDGRPPVDTWPCPWCMAQGALKASDLALEAASELADEASNVIPGLGEKGERLRRAVGAFRRAVSEA